MYRLEQVAVLDTTELVFADDTSITLQMTWSMETGILTCGNSWIENEFRACNANSSLEGAHIYYVKKGTPLHNNCSQVTFTRVDSEAFY